MSQLFGIAVGIILVGCFLIWAIKLYIMTKMEHRANEWRRQQPTPSDEDYLANLDRQLQEMRAEMKRKAEGRVIIQ